MLKNSEYAYGSLSKFLHWMTALLVLFMLTGGYFIDDLPWPTVIHFLFNLHKLTGIFILILIVFRMVWHCTNPRPRLPSSVKKWEGILAHMVQGLLYICLLLMPLSGWAMVTAYNRFPSIGSLMLPMPGIPLNAVWGHFFAEVHSVLAISLLVLLSLHILGALKHYFIDRDGILQRMLPRCCHGRAFKSHH